MWKALVGIVLATAVVVSSVALYPHRHRLFRPDVGRVGGTRLVLKLEGDADPEAVAAALQRRLDPNEAEGVVAHVESGAVAIDVPKGRRHDENLERAKRLLGRPGRLRVGIFANETDDAEALAAGRRWLTAANRKALEEAFDKGRPLPPLPGRFKGKGSAGADPRYEWVTVDVTRASITHGMFGMAGTKEAFPLHHEYLSAKGGTTTFLLLRLVPDAEALENGHVQRARVQELSRGRYSTRVVMQFDAEGRRRLNDLVAKQAGTKSVLPRRLALALDGDVLFYFEIGAALTDTTFIPAMDTVSDGEDVVALIRSPLPAGARPSVEEEQALPGK